MEKLVSVFIFFTTFLSIIITIAAKGCWTNGWAINVVNDIDNNKAPIQVHCKSKDDDIGMKSLGFHQSVDWKFCEKVITPSTLYFCHFYMGNKEQVFDVFNDTHKSLCQETDKSKDYWACTWLVRPDGFYIVDRKDGGEKVVKIHDWKQGRV
ncbi:S-protein homolog 18-like [Rutidosis leptorrhynchoides]|uniref:S-protein homolog 18-like n=1 Tax=Rutidosis leptorrhynchoides TaxID=125765 RepID=UPI003A99F85D